jgi:hypothetical protein
VKWKESKKLKPSIILKKIDSFKIINENGTVSFSGNEYFNATASLQSMVRFPSNMKGLNQEAIVSRAVSNVAKNYDLEAKRVIDEINSLVKNDLARREDKYHILTSISLKQPYPDKNILIEGCRIRFLEKTYPKKFTGRDELIKNSREVIDGTPLGYAKVIVSLKSKSAKDAVTRALRVVDIKRAIWSILSNPGMELMGQQWKPINKVRLGGAHTVHKERGGIATEMFWYEPNFVKAIPFSPLGIKNFKSNSRWALKQLNASPYSDLLKEALLRYVRALDERDQNVALIRLWGALESLTTPSEANYDMLTRRCSFLFKERDYHKQVLEHLREYRNSSVHAGDQSERAKTNCFQLQFYFHHLLIFHLNNSNTFKSLEEANKFLDLPSEKGELENRKSLIEKAIKFIS